MASWLKCRYYENVLPELDTLVMVNIKQTTEMGVYVKLLEYDYVDAMIPLSEISRRRIRSLNKHVRIGQNEVAVVIRVDKEKGYIDLSKSRVSDEDIIKCRDNYQKLKVAHSIVRHVAEKLGIPVTQLYETISWPLAKRYGTALEAFRASIVVPSVWDGIEFASPKLKEELVKHIAMRLTPNPIKLRADFEVQCFGYDGIDAIKKALHAGEALATKDIALKVRLVAPPLYVLNCYRCYDAQEGIRVMKKSLDAIKKSIESIDGGTFILTMEPRAVNAADDEVLKKLMARKERENREVSADGDKDLSCEYGFEHALVK